MEAHIETIIENNNKPEIIEFFEHSEESIDIHENVLTEVDPTVPKHVKDITEEDIKNWNKSSANASDIIYEDNTGQGVDNVQDSLDEAFRQIEGINDEFDNIDGKNIPFTDNYGYGTPDNVQDALDYAFNEIDNRPPYSDLANHVAFHYKQVKTETQKETARKNINARGLKWLGEIDVDEYDGDIGNFIDTLIQDGDYCFVDSYDNFYWYVSVYNIDNVLIGQTYYSSDEGYFSQYYRAGSYNENNNTVDWDGWRYNLNNVSAQGMFAPASHVHYKNISTSLPIRTYLEQYTSFGDKDLRVISSANKHIYIVKMDYYNYVNTNGIYTYSRYQEYYDLEEPNKIYKRAGYYNPSTRVTTWEDWCEFNSDTHVLETNEQQEGAELGEELVNATNWIIDGWTGNLSEGFTHVSGNANPLTFEMPEETEENYYIIEFETNISLNDADLAVSIGNDIGALMYGQRTPIRLGIKSTSNGNLLFTPSTTWTGKIFNISIKKIIADSESILNVTDTTGANSFEIRPTIAQQKNIFIGIDSGKKNISGYESVSLGESALKENMSGFWNTAVGKSALENNISGSRNIAIGYVALQDNISGLRNVGIGTFALHSNKTGSRNIAIGADSLDKNIEGSKNIAIGVQSLYRNIKGIDNTAIGDGAVGSLTEGSRNVGVGTNALSGVTTGAGNLGVGYGCLANVGTGSNNVGIGINSLYKLQNGSNNVGIGNNAGRGNTNASHSNLVAIGTSTGSGLTKGTYYNVFIGGLAGQNVTTGSFNIIIGGQVNADSPTENYQLNIGNLIKGSMKEGSRYAEINGGLQVNELPTSDPKIAGRIWNDNGTLKISSGT